MLLLLLLLLLLFCYLYLFTVASNKINMATLGFDRVTLCKLVQPANLRDNLLYTIGLQTRNA